MKKRNDTLLKILLIMASCAFPAAGTAQGADSGLANQQTAEIRRLLNEPQRLPRLYFPASVSRLYRENNFRPAWIKPQNGEGQAWQGMLLLDCVAQYGLSPADYHPRELGYADLHGLLDTPGKASPLVQARFDILLTDAIITFMNHLHYGKMNPYHPAEVIDAGGQDSFHAETALLSAMARSKGYDFLTAVEAVQPKGKAYSDLQAMMRRLAGRYAAYSASVHDSDLRLIAINLERLRWAAIEDSTFILINIPAYRLLYVTPDSIYRFRVAVGRPGNPTPVLNSALRYFTTAPDVRMLPGVIRREIIPAALSDSSYLFRNHLAIYNQKGEFLAPTKATIARLAAKPDHFTVRHASGCDRALGNLVFHFANPYGVDLHDMPQRGFFDRADRALGSRCIWVENAASLGDLLLKNDGRQKDIKTFDKAVSAYKRVAYVLRRAVPIRVAYLTCMVKDGELVTYQDIYTLDKSLEMALYPDHQSPAVNH